MAQTKFVRGTNTQIQTQAIADGTLYIAKDIKVIYTDVSGTERISIGHCIVVPMLSDRPAATAVDTQHLYYVTEDNGLYKSNGTAYVRINAPVVATEGSVNGTINIDGNDIPVHGLGSAAYESTTAFDPAGSASAVLGTSSDEATANTVHGVKKLADSKVASVTAGNNAITIAGSATAPTVAVRLSVGEGQSLTVADDGLFVSAPAGDSYTMVKKDAPSTGFTASYALQKNGVDEGAVIDIPKDFLVKEANVETVTEDDVPYVGARVGDKYIDFVINASDASETEDHLYIPLNDIIEPYTGGNGILISSGNEVSVQIDATNANGLTVGADGVALSAATASTNGAMTSAMVSKLAGIEEEAQVNVIEEVTFNGVAATVTGKSAALTLEWTDLT